MSFVQPIRIDDVIRIMEANKMKNRISTLEAVQKSNQKP
jgi:ribosomal protein S28E/S33